MSDTEASSIQTRWVIPYYRIVMGCGYAVPSSDRLFFVRAAGESAYWITSPVMDILYKAGWRSSLMASFFVAVQRRRSMLGRTAEVMSRCGTIHGFEMHRVALAALDVPDPLVSGSWDPRLEQWSYAALVAGGRRCQDAVAQLHLPLGQDGDLAEDFKQKVRWMRNALQLVADTRTSMLAVKSAVEIYSDDS